MSKRFTRKWLIIGIALALAVSMVGPTLAAAAPKQDDRPPAAAVHHHRGVPKAPEAGKALLFEGLLKELGVTDANLAAYKTQGHSPADVLRAAVLAKMTGKTVDQVLAMKTPTNNWQDVLGTLNVKVADVRKEMRTLLAGARKEAGQEIRLSKRAWPRAKGHRQDAALFFKAIGLDQDTLQQYVAKGYRRADVVKAGVLAKVSGKTIDQILAMKTASNTWEDVTASLGLTRQSIRTELQKLIKAQREPAKSGN